MLVSTAYVIKLMLFYFYCVNILKREDVLKPLKAEYMFFV